MSDTTWYLRTQDETFGPETRARLVEWAQMGRIQPGQEVSQDQIVWRRVEDVPFLDMRFSIDLGDGNPRGPFNRKAAEALLASGRLPAAATLVESRAPFGDEGDEAERDAARDAAGGPGAPGEEPGPVPQSAPADAEESARTSPPPAGPSVRIVEKIVEKKVVDDARVKELEGLLAEERRHTADLQNRLDGAAQAAAAREQELQDRLLSEARDASAREAKMREQIVALETELRRLPETASEIADVQAAVYGLMTTEATEIAATLESEKKELAEFKRRADERIGRLEQRRRELIRCAGSDIEEMTRRALANRPEDPRTAQLREELRALRLANEKAAHAYEQKVQELTNDFSRRRDELIRQAEGAKDVVQLRAEVQELREKLQLREQELLSERQRNEAMRQQQALRQQTLMTRLAALESPSIGTTDTLATNQSREARMVKLPNWMRFGK